MRWRTAAPTVALLLTGCAAGERVPMAAHGLGRLAYKQLVAVSRAAEDVGSGAAAARDDGDTREASPEIAPAQRTDVPPGSWVAAFSAPDPEPLPSRPEPASASAPTPEAVAPPPVALQAPEPEPESPPEPRAAEVPVQVNDPGPDVVVFVPGAREVEGAQAPVLPSPGPPMVTVVVVTPVVSGRGYTSPHAPGQQHVAARPALHPGGIRLGAPASGRR